MGILISTIRTDGAGYFLNDGTASGSGKQEDDVFCCSHCQAIVTKTQYKEHGGWCRLCRDVICGPCMDRTKTHGCEPFSQKIDEALELNHRAHQRAKLLGI